MLHSAAIMCLVISSVTQSAHVPARELRPPETVGPTVSSDVTKSKSVSKRQTPFIGFIPVTYLPPIVELRYVINLQTPDARCFSTAQTTSTPPTKDNSGPVSRFGDTPMPNEPQRPNQSEPSRCVWAIVACCSPGSTQIRYPCFELLGCSGPFWDTNPCEPEVVQAAANTALKFYMLNMNATETNKIEPDNL